MFLFAHLGIGSKLAAPFGRGLPKKLILLGTILPDLVDKPLYHGLSLATGRRSTELGLISCTRTFGHTAVALILLSLAAWASRSKAAFAVALGIATHLLLDNVADSLAHADPSSALMALLWPLHGGSFAPMPPISVAERLSHVLRPYELWPEVAGLLILAWDAWKRKNRAGILQAFEERKATRKRARR